jgi:hypothetical protein
LILFRVQTTIPQRTNEDLPAPQKLLTAPPPPPTNRFTSNEQTSRFSRPQQQEESNTPVNGHPPLMPELNRPYSMKIFEREFILFLI